MDEDKIIFLVLFLLFIGALDTYLFMKILQVNETDLGKDAFFNNLSFKNVSYFKQSSYSFMNFSYLDITLHCNIYSYEVNLNFIKNNKSYSYTIGELCEGIEWIIIHSIG